MKPKSGLERFTDGIPVFFSYLILVVTWFAFTFGLSIPQTLYKRHQVLHFVTQQVIGNALYLLAIASLFVVSTRSPGAPDRGLAPPNVVPPFSRRASSELEKEKHRTRGPPSPLTVDENDDDIPLKFLRNSRWVNSRIGKDRPSPLPLTHKRRSTPARPVSHDSSLDSSSSGTYGQPTLSALPLNVNPFAPSSIDQTGEDLDEFKLEQRQGRAIEGRPINTGDAEVDDDEECHGHGQSFNDEDRLLPAATSRTSIMAKSNTGQPRWCKKCDNWKPDRCHHCSYCRRCVLKMDHHCVWIGNCVGFDNYKPFWLFITYGTLLAIYITVESGLETYRFFQDPDEFYRQVAADPTPRQCEGGQPCSSSTSAVPEIDLGPVAFIALTLMGVFLGLGVGSLAGYHWWLSCNNITTLESMTLSYPSALLEDPPLPHVTSMSTRHRGVRQGWKPDHLLTRDERNRYRREARKINVYDRGWRANLTVAFGDRSIFLAGLPWIRAYHQFDRTAGHYFEVDHDKLERLRMFTRELRMGDQQDTYGESESETETETDASGDKSGVPSGRDQGGRPGYRASFDEPPTAYTLDSGINGDDEDDDDDYNDDDAARGLRNGPSHRIKWFEA